MTDQNTSPKNAAVIKRFAAMFYDILLLMGIAMAYGAVILFIEVQIFGLELAEGEKAKMSPLQLLGLIGLFCTFFCFFWRKQGQTLGMQAWKLKLIDQNGNNPCLKQCLFRLAYATVSFTCLGLGYWWQWLDKDKLTWHDRWSKTRVLQLEKN